MIWGYYKTPRSLYPACILVVCIRVNTHIDQTPLRSEFFRKGPRGNTRDNLNRQGTWFEPLCVTWPRSSAWSHWTWLTGGCQYSLNDLASLSLQANLIFFKCSSFMKSCSIQLFFPIYKVTGCIKQRTWKRFPCLNPLLEVKLPLKTLKITCKTFWRLWQTSCFFVLGGGKSWTRAQRREHSVNNIAADCYWIVQNIRWLEYVIINKLFTGQSITNSDRALGILL